jgi:hypothetical protein
MNVGARSQSPGAAEKVARTQHSKLWMTEPTGTGTSGTLCNLTSILLN